MYYDVGYSAHMVSLTFYGGVNEVGGNKILLQDRDTKVFLDFGMSFAKRGKYYNEFLNPRSSAGIRDFLTMNLLPNIEGVYRKDLLEMGGFPTAEPDIDAALLSHAHADHSSYMSFLHEKIPVYVGETTLLILNAVAEAGTRGIESEIIDFKTRPIIYGEEPIKRIFKTFRTGHKIRIGSMEVEPVHVDHSIPGAYGFIIHTSEGTIVYTGDVRLHGSRPEMTEEFVEKARETKPAVLITEGTRINEPQDNSTELKVRQTCTEAIGKAEGLAVAGFNFKDADRLRTFYHAAVKNGRKLVISLKDAFYLKWLSRDPNLKVPPPHDDNITIYIPRRGSGGYDKADYRTNELEFLNMSNACTAEDIKEEQGKQVCAFDLYDMGELIDIDPEPEGLFIHSLSEPFNEESELDYRRLRNWLDHFYLNLLQSHCSGHAPGGDLLRIAKGINAKRIIPIHTEHASMFKVLGNAVMYVREGKTYVVR